MHVEVCTDKVFVPRRRGHTGCCTVDGKDTAPRMHVFLQSAELIACKEVTGRVEENYDIVV